jgi:hypothetical protein
MFHAKQVIHRWLFLRLALRRSLHCACKRRRRTARTFRFLKAPSPKTSTAKTLDHFAASEGVYSYSSSCVPIAPFPNVRAAASEVERKIRSRAKFWLVYPDRAETALQIKAHLRDYQYSIGALRDTRRALVKRSQATITPEAAVFDSSGRLALSRRIDNCFRFGPLPSVATTHELDDAILAALDGRRISTEHVNAVGCYISDLK